MVTIRKRDKLIASEFLYEIYNIFLHTAGWLKIERGFICQEFERISIAALFLVTDGKNNLFLAAG